MSRLPFNGERLYGLYVSVPLRPNDDLAAYLENLPHSSGRAMDPDDLHASLLYGGDCPYSVDTCQSYERMETTRAKIEENLARRCADGIEIIVDPAELEPFGRSLGFRLNDSDELFGLQAECVGLAEEGLGVQIGLPDNALHVSLLKQRRRNKDPVTCYLSQAELAIDGARQASVAIVQTSMYEAEHIQHLRRSSGKT